MPKFLQLQIPTPCHEDWNQMTPEAQGRFCNSCQKAVVDFTQMSDAQLIAFFKKPKQSTCGRFTQEQLENDILIPRKRIPWVKYFFQFTLPAFLLSLKTTAQIGRVNSSIEKIAPEKKSPGHLENSLVVNRSNNISTINALEGRLGWIESSVRAKEQTPINGTIKDPGGRPIPYASVSIQETRKGVAADSLGNFSISQVPLPCTIIFSSVGFVTEEVRLTSNQKLSDIQISLAPALSGEVVVVAGFISSRSLVRKRNKKPTKEQNCLKPLPTIPSLALYPNPIPSSTPLHLKWQNFEPGNYVIEVYSISGALMQSQKLILEKDLKETTLSVNQLTGGNYFVRLINEKTGKQISQQFIVQE